MGFVIVIKPKLMADYIYEIVVERISKLYVDCPECENIILEDEQYGCTTCGGGGRINVFNFVQENRDYFK